MWPSCKFLKDFWAYAFWIAHKPFECNDEFFSSFLVGGLIAPLAYLGNWAFVAYIIVAKILSDCCPFLSEVIGANSFGPSFSKPF